MYEKFQLNNLNEKDFKKIISNLGFKEGNVSGKNYKGVQKQGKHPSYNINLPHIKMINNE